MSKMAMLRIAGVLGLAACTADSATAPAHTKAGDAAHASVSLNVVDGGSLDFSADLDNITDVVLPGFTDAAVAEAFGARIVTLKTLLANGDRTGAAAELVLARKDLKDAPDASNPTDLGYIEMVFSNIDTALAR